MKEVVAMCNAGTGGACDRLGWGRGTTIVIRIKSREDYQDYQRRRQIIYPQETCQFDILFRSTWVLYRMQSLIGKARPHMIFLLISQADLLGAVIIHLEILNE